MLIRKLIPLAGLVLAIAALSPATALANHHCTHYRPTKGWLSGTSINTPTGPLTGELSHEVMGVSAHLGKFTRDAEGTYEITPPSTLSGGGSFTVVAANGDEVFGTFSFTGEITGEDSHTSTVHGRFEGGTGRFKDARGYVIEHDQTIGTSIEGTFKGRVCY